MRAPHWKVFYRPPPPLLESISDSVHCTVAQEGCIVRREKWYHHVAGARWISYSFSSALSFSPEIYLLMGCCCTNVSCIGIFCGRQIFYPRSKLHFQEYFPLQYHTCPFNTRWREYRFLLLLLHCHPSHLCFKRSCSFPQKVIASLQLPSPGSFISNFLQGFTSFKLSAIFVAVVYHEQGLFCNISRRHWHPLTSLTLSSEESLGGTICIHRPR